MDISSNRILGGSGQWVVCYNLTIDCFLAFREFKKGFSYGSWSVWCTSYVTGGHLEPSYCRNVVDSTWGNLGGCAIIDCVSYAGIKI